MIKSFVSFTDNLIASKNWPLRFLIILVLALSFTVACVSLSEKVGRLSSTPQYDDSGYMLKAELFHLAWQQGGIANLWKSIRELSLHSPFCEGLAALSYTLFGHQDRSPYLGNGVIILAYLGILTWLLRGIPFLPWAATLFLFLCLPIATNSITVFRPDMCCGLCLAFAGIYVLTSSKLLKGGKEAAFSGVIFAAAYLTKPATFALTTVVLFAAWGGRLLHAWILRKEQEVTPKEALRSIAICGGVLLALAGWYYLFFGNHIWSYFYANSFGPHKDLWTYKANWIGQMLFYLNGDGAIFTLGKLGKILLTVALLLFVWRLFVAPRAEKLCCLLLLILGTLIYAILTCGTAKNIFLGAPFHMFIIFTTAYLINASYLQSSLSLKRCITIGLIIFAPITALLFQKDWYYRDWIKKAPITRDIYYQATEGFTNILQSMKTFPRSILFVHVGPVCPEAVKIKMLRNQKNFELCSIGFYSSMDHFRAAQKNQDVIVVPDLHAKGVPFLPITPLLPDILKELAANPELSLHETIQTTDGSLVYVYARKGE